MPQATASSAPELGFLAAVHKQSVSPQRGTLRMGVKPKGLAASHPAERPVSAARQVRPHGRSV